jgi:hypothetical protein
MLSTHFTSCGLGLLSTAGAVWVGALEFKGWLDGKHMDMCQRAAGPDGVQEGGAGRCTFRGCISAICALGPGGERGGHCLRGCTAVHECCLQDKWR